MLYKNLEDQINRYNDSGLWFLFDRESRPICLKDRILGFEILLAFTSPTKLQNYIDATGATGKFGNLMMFGPLRGDQIILFMEEVARKGQDAIAVNVDPVTLQYEDLLVCSRRAQNLSTRIQLN
ncbi:MAG TPA: hypothetical protein VNM22_11980 [Candidatus Limnocylindrales bacterium]|nr:hypothetical protein [Candidatus Limnocylindrales bacterium]